MMWDRIIITKNGKNDAVIMSYEEYESWVETLSLSEEEKIAITSGREMAKKGETFYHRVNNLRFFLTYLT